MCKTLNFTGYTNIITMTFGITVSGSITLVAAMTISGTGGLSVNAACTLTSNGKTWPNVFTFTGTGFTSTLADNWDIDGQVSFNFTDNSSTKLVNGFTMNCGGGIVCQQATTSGVAGTTNFVFDGTGNLQFTLNRNTTFQSNITVNTAGTCNFLGGWKSGNTFTHTASGAFNSSGTFRPSGCNLDMNGESFDIIELSVAGGSSTVTLLSDFECNTLTGTSADNSSMSFNGFTIYVNVNFNISTNANASLGGTTVVVLQGTGNYSCTGVGFGRHGIGVVINTAGTITSSSQITRISGSMTYTAGTFIPPTTLILGTTTGATAITLNTNGIIWNNVTTNGIITVTLSSDMSITGLLTFGLASAPVIFNGNNFYVSGGVTLNSTTGSISGTTKFIINGSSTITNNLTSGSWNNDIDISAGITAIFAVSVKQKGIMAIYGIVAGLLVSTSVARGTICFG